MAGKVVVSTLNNDTGVLATQNGMTGIAKAWVSLNGATIKTSFNVSSITTNASGDYTINFTTALPDANYAFTGSVGLQTTNVTSLLTIPYSTAPTTTALRFATGNTGGTLYAAYVSVSVFSS